MKRNTLITTLGLVATMGATALVPTMASANLQSDKNNMRNLAIAGAAIAGYGLLNHNSGATILGVAGAVLAGSQYQKDQSRQNSWNNRWDYNRNYHRDGNWNGGYNGNGSYNNRDYNTNRDYRDRNNNNGRDNHNQDRNGDHNGR